MCTGSNGNFNTVRIRRAGAACDKHQYFCKTGSVFQLLPAFPISLVEPSEFGSDQLFLTANLLLILKYFAEIGILWNE
jgi:hypothetical protein